MKSQIHELLKNNIERVSKKIFLTFTFVLIAQIGMAQDEAFKKDAIKVIEMSGTTTQIQLTKDQVLKMVPVEKQALFIAEFDASIPGLYDNIAKVYMEIFTKKEMKALIKFYKSPVGKKMTGKSSELAEKNIAASQEWGQKLQEMLTKYTQ